MLITQFVRQFTAQFIEADGSPPYSATWRQCVDLVKKWELLNGYKKITHGNAIDYPKNADGVYYRFVKNTPSGVPNPGDIIIFNWGKWGHVGIVVAANTRSVAVFEQNVPVRNICRVSNYNYLAPRCIGWLQYIGG